MQKRFVYAFARKSYKKLFDVATFDSSVDMKLITRKSDIAEFWYTFLITCNSVEPVNHIWVQIPTTARDDRVFNL
jgi:hypothetical protein